MPDAPQIPEAEMAFYRAHPELVQAVGDKATIYRIVLVTVFIIGFFLVLLSKAIKFGLIEAQATGWVELVVDLIFELGVALWGGVATTVLLQNYVERKYKEGRTYQQEIMKRLMAENQSDSRREEQEQE